MLGLFRLRCPSLILMLSRHCYAPVTSKPLSRYINSVAPFAHFYCNVSLPVSCRYPKLTEATHLRFLCVGPAGRYARIFDPRANRKPENHSSSSFVCDSVEFSLLAYLVPRFESGV
ncbi:uncharacterized protein F4812DRAFT_431293 [Daldinia caldariorum]|uniref:uncharacterized protein n=1 Tax=Daldinia caldariorum TaxID=326644 RepID=UPI0020077C2E|nr:uncharacterized protein F4812DRAFT_431293 [Daldinia caldariorum]KAI1467118.1 hypothetical protein F4812DRAFT_431293 [Daldinia caldariorum]